MKILLFGAGGQVGSEIIAEFEQRGYLSLTGLKVVPVTRVEVDLTDYTKLLSFLDNQAPDWIVNASAYTDVDKAEIESETAFAVNQGAVQCIADYCGSTNSKLLHLSTDYVFDGEGSSPLSEDDSVSPSCIYGASKLAGERAIRDTLRQHIILRVAWVFGARGNNFVKTMLRLAQNKAVLKVVDDQHGAPTSARSIAKVIVSLVSNMFVADENDDRWGVYHFSGYPFTTWSRFADTIFYQAQKKRIIDVGPEVVKISTSEYPTPAKRPANSRLDCSKILKVFGIEPDDWHTSLDEMLDEVQREYNS